MVVQACGPALGNLKLERHLGLEGHPELQNEFQLRYYVAPLQENTETRYIQVALRALENHFPLSPLMLWDVWPSQFRET